LGLENSLLVVLFITGVTIAARVSFNLKFDKLITGALCLFLFIIVLTVLFIPGTQVQALNDPVKMELLRDIKSNIVQGLFVLSCLFVIRVTIDWMQMRLKKFEENKEKNQV
jgi:hypothetical protein